MEHATTIQIQSPNPVPNPNQTSLGVLKTFLLTPYSPTRTITLILTLDAAGATHLGLSLGLSFRVARHAGHVQIISSSL